MSLILSLLAILVGVILVLLAGHWHDRRGKRRASTIRAGRQITVFMSGRNDLPPGKSIKIRLTLQNYSAVADYANSQDGYIKTGKVVDEAFLHSWVIRGFAEDRIPYAAFYSTNVAGVLG